MHVKATYILSRAPIFLYSRDLPIFQHIHSVHGGHSIEARECEAYKTDHCDSYTAQRDIGSTVAAVSTAVFTYSVCVCVRERESEWMCVQLYGRE